MTRKRTVAPAVSDQAPGNGAAPAAILEGPPDDQAPVTLEDLLPTVAGDSAPGANPAAAVHALDVPPAQEPPPPPPPVQEPAPGGAGRIDARPHLTGEVSSGGAERWSKRRLEKANRKDLARRIRELEDEVSKRPALGQAGDGAPALPPGVEPNDELRKVLRLTFTAASAALEYFVGPAMKLDDDEKDVLAETGAPALLPKYAQVRATAPVLPFLAAVAGIVGPKVLEAMRQARQQKQDAGGMAEPAPAAVESVTLELVREEPAPGPFGGPRE